MNVNFTPSSFDHDPHKEKVHQEMQSDLLDIKIQEVSKQPLSPENKGTVDASKNLEIRGLSPLQPVLSEKVSAFPTPGLKLSRNLEEEDKKISAEEEILEKNEAAKRCEARKKILQRKSVDVSERLKSYLDTSPILNLFIGLNRENLRSTLENALKEQIAQNDGRWPEVKDLKNAEQFFWNFKINKIGNCDKYNFEELEILLYQIFKVGIKNSFSEFKRICEPYTRNYSRYEKKIEMMTRLFPIFQAIPEAERDAFEAFCEPYTRHSNGDKEKIEMMTLLLPIFQAIPEAERVAFDAFCKFYTRHSNGDKEKIEMMSLLLPIFQSIPEAERDAFDAFCESYTRHCDLDRRKIWMMTLLLPIFQSISEVERAAFDAFCEPYTRNYSQYEKKIERMTCLLPIFQAIPEAERAAFDAFCESYTHNFDHRTDSTLVTRLFEIFQAISKDERIAFDAFCEPYTRHSNGHKEKIEMMNRLLPIFQTIPKAERGAFDAFCEPYTRYSSRYGEKINSMNRLLPIFQTIPKVERGAFNAFCAPYIRNSREYTDKVGLINRLLPIFQAIPEAERGAFDAFCAPYMRNSGDYVDKTHIMLRLLPLFQKISKAERGAFHPFFKTYTNNLEQDEDKIKITTLLLPIFQSLPEAKRDAFKVFSEFYTRQFYKYENCIEIMTSLIPILQTFLDSEAERDGFKAFCKPHIVNNSSYTAEMDLRTRLFPIFQAIPEAEKEGFFEFYKQYRDFVNGLSLEKLCFIYVNDRENFGCFMQRHRDHQVNDDILIQCSNAFIDRSYLELMRVDAALKAEKINPIDSKQERRTQAMYETSADSPLPILFAEDPFITQVPGWRTANAHDFDAIYEQERPILWEIAEPPQQGTQLFTIYNSQEAIHDYVTNQEVEDFINYLETEIKNGPSLIVDGHEISGSRAASLIKQMLGIEPKGEITRGHFAPYLGSSMYYANPNSPKGDEMLGRVWYFMKNLHKNSATEAESLRDKANEKKSVVLALLDAAEISETNIDTHCQTRISGELFKLISWHLPGSHLRKLIAAPDVSSAGTDEGVDERMVNAPFRAKRLFDTLKREDSGSIRRLIQEQLELDGDQPPLWKRYEAYYDDLYQRTKNDDGVGYRKDENLLTRDDLGNLVINYHSDGSERENPIIVYYQAEFQVFEKNFTELMREEFEEQRGNKY